MQSNCTSTMATDVPPSAPNSASDYIATGMIWPYSQLFSSPYFSHQAPPPTTAYPIPIYCPTKPASFQNANLLRSTENTSSNNHNNMTIQIGLQCLNDRLTAAASTTNSAVTPAAPVRGFNSGQQMDIGEKSNGHRSNAAQSTISEDSVDGANCREAVNRKLQEFTKLAIHGCDLAEKVTKNHKYRPCFKKIDSLCARLKQDISRPDGVLNNLNSQGVAWAVKDFIFVFTRIINAWLILKGYVYNHSEGMKKVQAAFSGNFQQGFLQWQQVTQELIENIIESFENLDETVQKSRTIGNGAIGPMQGNGGMASVRGVGGGGSSSSSALDLSNFLWENKEVTMRSTGNKEEKLANRFESNKMTVSGAAGTGGGGAAPGLSTPIFNEAERDEFETYYKTGLYQSVKRKGTAGEEENGFCSEDVEEQKDKSAISIAPEMDLIDRLNLESSVKRYEQETVDAIHYLLSKVRDMKEAAYFFNAHFLKNYFPGFETVIKDFKDIRTIMLEAEQGGYKHMFAVVADFKMIIQSCRLYLSLNPNEHLTEIVANFERKLGELLAGFMAQ